MQRMFMFFKSQNKNPITKMSSWKVANLIILLQVLNSCSSWFCNQNATTIITKDSILTEIRIDTIRIQATPKLLIDTITKKVTDWKFDTIIQKKYRDKIIHDTIRIDYNFDRNQLQFLSKTSPDSTWKEIETRTETIIKEQSWWENFKDSIFYIIAGIILAIILIYAKLSQKV